MSNNLRLTTRRRPDVNWTDSFLKEDEIGTALEREIKGFWVEAVNNLDEVRAATPNLEAIFWAQKWQLSSEGFQVVWGVYEKEKKGGAAGHCDERERE